MDIIILILLALLAGMFCLHIALSAKEKISHLEDILEREKHELEVMINADAERALTVHQCLSIINHWTDGRVNDTRQPEFQHLYSMIDERRKEEQKSYAEGLLELNIDIKPIEPTI